MENKSQIVIRAMGNTNERGTNVVHLFYRVIADGVCERFAYRRNKFMTYKKPMLFKFTKEESYKTFDEETQTWIPTYNYDVKDEDSKDYGREVESAY